jgi:prolipoprotein diacylglyceryl transferase
MLSALLATIPAPPFRNLELGPLTLHGYGLTMGIAIIVAISLTDRLLKQMGVQTKDLTSWMLLTVLGGFIGARLYHVASEPIRYFHHPGEIVQVWNGGLGIYGSVIGGAIVGLALAPRYNLPRGAIADAVAPALLIAQVIGRFGNYLNQELFGKPSTNFLALHVDRQYRPAEYLDRATFEPTFLYEAAGNLVLFIIALVVIKRWTTRAPGVLFPLYLAGYSVVRIIVEPLRIDHANHWLGVRQNVWVAGVIIVVSLIVAAYMQRRSGRNRRVAADVVPQT